MKKFFSFLMVAILAVSVSAATTTFTFSSVDSQTQDGFTVSLDKGSGTAAPNYQGNWPAPRLYANNTITISGKNITSLSIKFAKGNNKKDYASASVNVGEYVSGGEATSTDDYKTDTWTGEATSVIITLGATGQRSIIELTVTGEGKEGGTTDPADDGNITNPNLCDAYYYTEGEYAFYDFDLYKNLTSDYDIVFPEVYVVVEAKKKTAINGTYDILYAGYWKSAKDSIETDEYEPVGTLTIQNSDDDGEYNLKGSFVGSDNKTYTFDATVDVLAYDANDEDYPYIALDETDTAIPTAPISAIETLKLIRDNQLIIKYKDREYNITGTFVK